MGAFSIFHWLIVLVFFIGIPVLVVMLILKSTRGRTRAQHRLPGSDRLRELADLRDRNLISEEEFQRKRAELIRQL